MHKDTAKKWVWVPLQPHNYVPAYIHATDNNKTTVITQDNQKITISSDKIYRMNPSKFNMADDLALLSHLNEPSVLHNLKQRYEHDLIYTYSGLFLLAINPYKEIRNLYDTNTIIKYKQQSNHSRNYINNKNLQPHIFAVSNDAYNSMMMNKEDQSILITGESGAGKTENTKKVINFLAHIANGCEIETESSVDDHISQISAKVLETNVLLESFGNAQTVKNDNSSRFGKFIKIEFLKGKITGAYIEKYLLEKSRVTRVNANERNFHVFYQLIQAIRKNENKKKKSIKIAEDINEEYEQFLSNLRITLKFEEDVKVTDFKYLKNTNSKIDNVDDAKEFYELYKSMDILEFTNEEKVGVFKILSIILHLGNLEFKEENDQAEILNIHAIKTVCELLKINHNNFLNSLLNPITKAGNEDVVNSRTKEQVVNIVEALARLLYERIFDTIIVKINNVLGRSSYFERKNTNFIGVLDIAGFEIFNKNDFEQFCINFTNEKLQQFFNNHMFILEQEIYKKENIDWKFIDFGLNLQPTIDLIEKSNPIGILSYLDEECVMPKGTDRTFLEKLREIEKQKNKYFGTAKNEKDTFKNESNLKNQSFTNFQKGCTNNENQAFRLSKLSYTFIIDHYAGQVEYVIDNWLKKNKDPHFDYLTSLLKQSTDIFVQSLFSFDSQGKKGFFRTVAQKHKDSLNLLMTQLKKTNPYFVRCIIPNTKKASNNLYNDLVIHQLKCNGVMEGIRISRQGYPTRILYKEFRKRYEVLLQKNNVDFVDNKEVSIKILKIVEKQIQNHEKEETNNVENNLYKLGNTMIFFRQGVVAEIEDLRERKVDEIAVELQSLVRKKLTVYKYNNKKIKENAIKIIQKNAKLSLEFKNWSWWKLYQKIKPLLEITKLDEEIRDKEERLNEAKETIIFEKARNEEIKNILKTLENEKKEMEKEMEQERIILKEREDLLNALREEKSNDKKRIEILENEIDSIKTNYNNFSEKNKKLEDDKKLLNENVEKYENILNDKSNELKDLISENAKLKDKIIENNAELSNTKNSSKTKIDQLLLEKEKEIGKLKGINEEKEKLIFNKDREIVKLNDDYGKIQKEKEILDEQIKKNEEETEKLKKECNNLLNQNEDITEKFEKLKNERNDLVGNNKKLKEEIDDFMNENEKLKQGNFNLEKKNDILEKNKNDLESLLKQEKDKNYDILQNTRKLERNLQVLNEELEEEKNKNTEKSLSQENVLTKIKNLNEKINNFEKELEDEKTINGELKQDNIKLLDENKFLQKSKLDEIFERENEFNKAKKNLKNKIQELESLLAENENKIDSNLLENENNKRKKLENLLKEEENCNLKLKNEIEMLKMENNNLKKKVYNLENKDNHNTNNSEKLKICLSEIDKLKKIISEKNKEYHCALLNVLEKYRKEEKELKIKNFELLNQLEDSKNQNQNYMNKIEELQKKIISLENNISEGKKCFEEKLNKSNVLISQLSKQNNDLEFKIDSIENVYKEQEKKNEKLLVDKDEKINKYEMDLSQLKKEESLMLEKIKNLENMLNKNEEYLSKLKLNFYGDKNMYFINENCSFEKCICDENTINKCIKDLRSVKFIEDLKNNLETEKKRNVVLQNENENLNFSYSRFSKEFDLLINKEKENNLKYNQLLNELKINKNLIEMKNGEVIMHKKDIKNLKEDLSLNHSIIKSLEFQIQEYKKRNDNLVENNKFERVNDSFNDEKLKREEAERKICIYENELEFLKNSLVEINYKFEEKNEMLNDLENENSKWKEELLKYKMRCNEYIIKINQLEREIEDERELSGIMKLK
ncbi:class II myosin [Gurleya vavrai]